MNSVIELTVYVPTSPRVNVAPGSAIVGSIDDRTGMLRLDYEGDVYGFRAGLTPADRYADNLRHAADRHTTRYPTAARQWITTDDATDHLTAVGTYLPGDRPLLFLTNPDAFDTWLTSADTTSDGVYAAVQNQARTNELHDLGRRIAAGDVDALIEYQAMHAHTPPGHP